MLFSDFWSENAALFERLMEIYSNPDKCRKLLVALAVAVQLAVISMHRVAQVSTP